MKKVVETVYFSMYKNTKGVTFIEMFLISIATYAILLGMIFTVLLFN